MTGAEIQTGSSERMAEPKYLSPVTADSWRVQQHAETQTQTWDLDIPTRVLKPMLNAFLIIVYLKNKKSFLCCLRNLNFGRTVSILRMIKSGLL